MNSNVDKSQITTQQVQNKDNKKNKTLGGSLKENGEKSVLCKTTQKSCHTTQRRQTKRGNEKSNTETTLSLKQCSIENISQEIIPMVHVMGSKNVQNFENNCLPEEVLISNHMKKKIGSRLISNKSTVEKKLKEEKEIKKKKSLPTVIYTPQEKKKENHGNKEISSLATMLMAENSATVSCGLLELALERNAAIDTLLNVVDQMVLALPFCKNEEKRISILDESMYRWMTQDRWPKYEERFSITERKARHETLLTYYIRRRLEHRKVLENRANKHSIDTFQTSSPTILSSAFIKYQQAPIKPLSKNHKPISRTQMTYDKNMTSEAWIDSWLLNEQKTEEKREIPECTQLLFLQSRVVVMSPVVEWSSREIGLFQLALYTYGPNFTIISQCIGTKSYKEAYVFYAEVFKKTLRYQIFKEFKKFTQWWHALQ
jgi:hypothetical protein